jgi:hypothetical protein
MPASNALKVKSAITKQGPGKQKKAQNTLSNALKVKSAITKQGPGKQKKAQNTLSTEKIWDLARKATLVLLLQRFVETRTKNATTGYVQRVIHLLYKSVYGMDTIDEGMLAQLENNIKLVAKKLGFDSKKTLHKTLMEFDNWLFGENYKLNMNQILRFHTNEAAWPRAFFTTIVNKFNDTSDEVSCRILGANYKLDRFKPNTEYCDWWKKAAAENQAEINNFMCVTAAASPPSAPAFASACWEHEAPPDVPAVTSGISWNAFPGERAEPVAAPEAVAELMLFNTCNPMCCHSVTLYDDIQDSLFELLPEYDASAEA